METQIFDIIDIKKSAALIQNAAQILRRGGTVAFPTETVYGLGANALDAEAVAKIFEAKGRPSDNPLIVHISEKEALFQLTDSVSEVARALIDAFWPGPLTLVLPKRSTVPACVTAGLDTVAVRMPSHPVARALIEASGIPVAAPSANLSGKPSPTDADHVIHDLSGRVDAIVCGKPSDVGLESTVLDVTGSVPMILRPGGVTREDIIRCVGMCDVDPAIEKQLSSETAPKSPGMKYTHYAPDAELIIINGEPDQIRLEITSRQKALEEKGLKVGIMTCDEHIDAYTCLLKKSLGSRTDLSGVASRLFSILRDFDKEHVDVILAEGYPREGIGHALMNRMLKAAGHHVINV